MELVYIYHSGFALLGEGFTVIIDYYRDSVEKKLDRNCTRGVIEASRAVIRTILSFTCGSF